MSRNAAECSGEQDARLGIKGARAFLAGIGLKVSRRQFYTWRKRGLLRDGRYWTREELARLPLTLPPRRRRSA